MIRIITEGITGAVINGRVMAKTKKDEPFCAENEDFLIKRGVAEKVEEEEDEEDDISSLSYNELKKKAKDLGIKAEGSKEELIVKIKDCMEGEEEDEEPKLTPAEPT